MFEEFGVDSEQIVLHGFVAKLKYNKRRNLWQVAKIDGRPAFYENWSEERYNQYSEFLSKVQTAINSK